MRLWAALPALLALALLSGCADTPSYRLLYPVQASKQELLRLEGTRLLLTDTAPQTALIVLNNPVSTYADIAFALENTTAAPLLLEQLPAARLKSGPLNVLEKPAYDTRLKSGERYVRPDGYERLVPQMQAFGCAAPKSADNVHPGNLASASEAVWNLYRRYREESGSAAAAYFVPIHLEPGETHGAVIRIDLPETALSKDRETMLLTLCPTGRSCEKIRLILQPLDASGKK